MQTQLLTRMHIYPAAATNKVRDLFALNQDVPGWDVTMDAGSWSIWRGVPSLER